MNDDDMAGTVPFGLRMPKRLRAALDRFIASEQARGTGADASECARRALSAGLEALGFPVSENGLGAE
jgi:hypothetical protein